MRARIVSFASWGGPLPGNSRALAGKRIVLTRAPEQARELSHVLEGMGAEILLLPMVVFAPPEHTEALDSALRKLDGFRVILFTSQNAVRFFVGRCRHLGMKTSRLVSPGHLIAAVGPATADAAMQEGLRVDLVAKNHNGEALVEELRGSLAGRDVLLPRSDLADDLLPNSLREAGARVTDVVAYRTLAPPALDPRIITKIRRAEVDAIVFASPSSFHNLCASVEASELARLSARIQFAAIGATTARALREAGARVEIEASESSAAGLADSIAEYYRHHTSRANATTQVK
jgi:uroporphyrinogen III methyltransferase / synthase